MVTKNELQDLRSYQSGANYVLSIYLDTDQSKVANLNRGFEAALKAELKNAEARIQDPAEKAIFNGLMSRALDFAASHTPKARGLVLFLNSEGSLWMKELNIPTNTQAIWDKTAFVVPLAEALDEYRRYAVAIATRSNAKVCMVQLGRKEKEVKLHSSGRVRHIKTTGMDHLYSQAGIQRNADEHVHAHLKQVVKALERAAAETPFDRLVLAGLNGVTNELFNLLPKGLASRVVGTAALPFDATDEQICSEVEKLETEVERRFELDRVAELLNAAGHRTRATTNGKETLKALNERRVRDLVLSENMKVAGGRCNACAAVYPTGVPRCDYCNGPLEPVENILPAAVARALADGAGIELLRDDAAERLNTHGGMGAFLRY